MRRYPVSALRREAAATGTAPTRLEALIHEACSEHKSEPDVELALEICELVNSKTSNAHSAAAVLMGYFTIKDPAQCVLALFVLDSLVINCGYPMHLAVSKRDFLNRLVYRFPPGPQFRLDQTHDLSMRLLTKWCRALCDRSKHRGDFGNIRLMHSLLKSKGFAAPQIDETDVQAIVGDEGGGGDGIKTREEIMDEERRVHEAKLEDLLRRGTDADLRAANELMRVMSGYVDSTYSAADSAVANSLTALEERHGVLEELLWNTDRSEYATNEAIQQLVSDLSLAMPKLEKLALSELPEDTLDRTIRLIQSINALLGQASGSAKSGQAFALISLDDDYEGNDNSLLSEAPHIQLEDEILHIQPKGSALSPSSSLPSPSPMAPSQIDGVATFGGPGVLLEVYRKEDMCVLVLLNHSEQIMRQTVVGMRDGTSVDFGTVSAMSAACRCSTLCRFLDARNLCDCTVTYEGSAGPRCTVNLARQ